MQAVLCTSKYYCCIPRTFICDGWLSVFCFRVAFLSYPLPKFFFLNYPRGIWCHIISYHCHTIISHHMYTKKDTRVLCVFCFIPDIVAHIYHTDIIHGPRDLRDGFPMFSSIYPCFFLLPAALVSLARKHRIYTIDSITLL